MTTRYISALPTRAPRNGRLLVHNFVHAATEDQWPGVNGFRCWTQQPGDAPKVTRCRCGWSGLPHYRGPDHGYGKPPSVKGKRMDADAAADVAADRTALHTRLVKAFGPLLA
jgi:hypothetical protein